MVVRRATLRSTESGTVMRSSYAHGVRGTWCVVDADAPSLSLPRRIPLTTHDAPGLGGGRWEVVVRPEGLEPPRVAPQDPKSRPPGERWGQEAFARYNC